MFAISNIGVTRIALSTELERLDKEHDLLIREIQLHRNEIHKMDAVINQINKQEDILDLALAEGLAYNLEKIIPEATKEQREAAAHDFVTENRLFRREIMDLECRNLELEKRLYPLDSDITTGQDQIIKLKHSILYHPKFIKDVNAVNGEISSKPFITRYTTDQMISNPNQFKRQLAGQKDNNIILLSKELSTLEENVATKQEARSQIHIEQRTIKNKIAEIKDQQEKLLGKMADKSSRRDLTVPSAHTTVRAMSHTAVSIKLSPEL